MRFQPTFVAVASVLLFGLGAHAELDNELTNKAARQANCVQTKCNPNVANDCVVQGNKAGLKCGATCFLVFGDPVYGRCMDA